MKLVAFNRNFNLYNSNIAFRQKNNNTNLFSKDGIVQYIDNDSDYNTIVSKLKAMETHEPFYTHKSQIAYIIQNAQDSNLAIKNLNAILTYKDEYNLNSLDVTSLLELVTLINNGEITGAQKEKYEFEGGLIDKDDIGFMNNIIQKERQSTCNNSSALMQGLNNLQLLSNALRNQAMYQLFLCNNPQEAHEAEHNTTDDTVA